MILSEYVSDTFYRPIKTLTFEKALGIMLSPFIHFSIYPTFHIFFYFLY